MSFNKIDPSRRKFTERVQSEVYRRAIDPSQPSLSVAGKTILVTGASRGLGAAMVDSFAKAHANAIVLTGRTEAPLNDAKLHLEKEYPGTEFIVVSVDVGVPESVTTMFELLKGQVQQIDVLVSNAGIISEYGPNVGETDGNRFWDDMMCQFLSSFSNYSSLSTVDYHPTTFIALTTMLTEPYHYITGYALSKLSLIKLVEILDLEYPNIRSYAIMPGLSETDRTPDASSQLLWINLLSQAVLPFISVAPRLPFYWRYLDARWDIEQVEERKEEIVKNDWLKLQISGY